MFLGKRQILLCRRQNTKPRICNGYLGICTILHV